MSNMLLKVVALPDNVPLASAAGAADATDNNAAATGRASILEKIIVRELDGRIKSGRWMVNFNILDLYTQNDATMKTNVYKSI